MLSSSAGTTVSISKGIAQGILSILASPSKTLLFSFNPTKPSCNKRIKLRLSANPQTLIAHCEYYYSMSALTLEEIPTPSRYIKPHDLGSADELGIWLRARMPGPLASWGLESGTKNVANLWVELLEGEIALEDACPPKRTVNVASVNIRNPKGYILVESHQELGDGNFRVRDRPLSEKMKAGESVAEACMRGIFEELGPVLGAPDNVQLTMSTYSKTVEERESVSYPGLLTCYVLHSVEALVMGLPDEDFSTEEDEEMNGGVVNSSKGAIGVKRHFWKWIMQN